MKKGFCTATLAMILLVLTSGAALAGWYPDRGMMYAGGYHMMGGGYMGWAMILLWILVLFALVSLVRWMLRLTDTKTGTPQPPLEILKQRLARGDIDIEEFERKRELL